MTIPAHRLKKLEQLVARPIIMSSVANEANILKNSFHAFVKAAWHIIEGDQEFIDNWHIKAMCEHLEAVHRLEIRKLIINVPPRSSKPVGKDTLLLKDNGERISISNINVGDKILTGKGRFRKIIAKHYQGRIKTLKITTFCGRTIIAGLEHPFLTPNGWVNAVDLQVDDVLGVHKVKEDFGNEVSEEEARLLGYFIGDGCGVGGVFNITCGDNFRTEDIKRCGAALGFDCNVARYESAPRTPRINLKKGKNEARAWLRSHGCFNKNSYTKKVPEAILRGNFNTIRNFIGAYFACDGTLGKKGVNRRDTSMSISSVNKSILDDVQHLLARIGIRSRVRKGIMNKPTKTQGDVYVSYNLEIQSQDDCYNFIKQIPILDSRFKILSNIKIIRQRFDNDINPDHIVNIESNGLEECYCLEVEEDHTFTANDIIVHNSTIATIMWPAWTWLHKPSLQYLCVSLNDDLSLKHSVQSRDILLSQWFKERWGHLFHIIHDQNTQSRYVNSKRGFRESCSILGKITGKGGHRIIIDDPNNAEEYTLERIRVNERYSGALSSRFNNPREAAIVLIQQRTNEKDLTGYIKGNDEKGEWVRFILPLEYESNRKCITVPLPSTEGKAWEDPRKVDGEFICPTRFPVWYIDEKKRDLGTYRYAGQYQQRPSPEEGGIIKKTWYRMWKHNAPPRIEHIIQSWDTALEANDHNAYSACTTWGIFYDDDWIENVIMLGAWRGRVEYPELREIAQKFQSDYRHTLSSSFVPSGDHRPDVVLVEAKASGHSLVQDLRKAGVLASRFDPNKHGDKIQRVRLISHLIEGGRVWMPGKHPTYDRFVKWADEFVEATALFPNSESRDYVDTMTQVLLHLDKRGWLTSPKDERPEKEGVRIYRPN